MVRRAVYDGCPSVSPPLLLRAFPAIFLGERSARSGHVHQAAVDGFLATFEATRPAYGAATWIEVSGAFRSWGVRKEPRVGYSIGLNWDDDGAGLQRDDETIIQSKMTFHLIVGIWQNSEGSIFSETVRLAEAKSLSRISRDLLVNPPWMNVARRSPRAWHVSSGYSALWRVTVLTSFTDDCRCPSCPPSFG